MNRSPTTSDHPDCRDAPSLPARRGLALVAGFWLVITVLLGARVAMFDEITGARLADLVSTRVASLAASLR